MLNLEEQKKRVKLMLREWDILTEPLTAPIVYHPGGWEDTVPEALRRQVIPQRLEKVANGGWDEATDAEVLCYLYTASLVRPFDSDWTNIYLYESSLFMPQVRDAIPDTPKELNDYQKSELRDLKRRIRASQIKRRKQYRKEANMSKRKLVIDEHEGSVLIGVNKEGCDPVTRMVQGSIDEALATIPEFLTAADAEWAVSSRRPAHKPPAAPKPVTAPPPKAEDLPLLQGTAKPAEAEAPKAEAEETKPAEEEIAPEPAAAVEEQAPEPMVPTPVEAAQEEVAAPAPEPAPTYIPMPTSEAGRERLAQATGQWEYWLKDGRGPFADIQAAMDEMDLDKANRPHHNRWDRLSTQLKERILRKPKA